MNHRSTNDEPPIWQRIRDAVAADRVFKFNIADPKTVDQNEYADRLFTDGVAVISDWGLANNGVTLAENGTEMRPDTLYKRFANPLKGEIDWDEVRDVMHQKIHTEEKTKIKSGKAVGSIRTFTQEMSVGDILLANFPSGIVPGRVAGPPIYDPSADYSKIAPAHVIYRNIEWAEVEGEQMSVDPDLLPPGFGTARHTIEKVNDPTPMVQLLRPIEWIDEELSRQI